MDGTLVDIVYHHVLAWKRALEAEGIERSVWRIHRKIGMSGGLFTHQLLRETGLEVDVRWAFATSGHRCRALGVALLIGGYGADELRQAGAIPRLRGPGRPTRPPRRSRRTTVSSALRSAQ